MSKKEHTATERSYRDPVKGHTIYVIDGMEFPTIGYAIVYLMEVCHLQSYEAVEYIHEIAEASGLAREQISRGYFNEKFH